MVVQFALENNSGEAHHPVKKKYLVARNRELKTSIFDYVHLSSSLLRKVRYGQSLDAALQTRNPWQTELPSAGRLSTTKENSKPSTPITRWHSWNNELAKPLTRRQYTNQDNANEDAIRYGRQIQLQAIDGGYLAVDSDGCLIKLPKSHRRDPSTVFALFPQNPLEAPGSKKVVSIGEQLFILFGAATITKHHELLYADAKNMHEPPKSLREAVFRHHQEHSKDANTHRMIPTLRGWQSTVWSFQSKRGKRERKALENGMLVQLSHRNLTMHYEIERVVKKKYAPISSGEPETLETDDQDPITQIEESKAESTPLSTIDSDDLSRQPGTSQTVVFNHVWLQHNDVSSQHDTSLSVAKAAKQTRWDNLWFLIDLATDQNRERELKRRQAELEAEIESELRHQHDLDERNEVDAQYESQGEDSVGEVLYCAGNNGDDTMSRTSKRMSVMNAHVFISKAAEETQRHAAAIIVRFLRRVFRREAERRAKDLIDRRIRRTGKHHRRGGVDECNLSTMQQLRVLQCFKPAVYGSQRVPEPSVPSSRRIPGISLQGSKYPSQEAHRLALLRRDLHHLGSEDFKVYRATSHQSLRQHSSLHRVDQSILISNLKSKHRPMMVDRDRDHKYHVQLAMARREKPPFRFGKIEARNAVYQHQRRQQPAPSPTPGLA